MPFKQFIIKQNDSVGYTFTKDDFDLSHWQTKKDSVALTGGRGASEKIEIEKQFYVLRHYLRGGFIARFSRDYYLWTGLSQSRPFQENKVIQLALQKSLPVPEVVAFCVEKSGLFYRASIISRFIDNEGTLASFLFDSELSNSLWIKLGELIRRLHQAGISHADLNANNILIDKNGKFYLIDFDKAKIISTLAKTGENNIQRLLRSLKKIQQYREQQNKAFHLTHENWQSLLAGYK